MSVSMIIVLTLFACITYGQTRDDYYSNWMGVMSENPGSTAFNFQIQDDRLIDIIIPGSHHSGMYPSAIHSNNYIQSTDTYYTEVFSYYPTAGNDRLSNWAQRQIGTIEDQLNAGCRFLDIRLESKSGTIYAHNGLLGATLNDMVTDIKNYLTNSEKKDIIILSFSDFINVNADSVFTTVQNELSPDFMKTKATYNIATDSIATLLTKGVKVIPFFDGTTTNSYVHGNGAILTGSESKNSTTSDVISHVISQLVYGWNTSTTNGEMNQIYYTLNIDTPSQFTSASKKYSNYLQFTGELALSLSKTIENYPKLYFGNIVIMDFIQASDGIDQVITLNTNYGICRDPVSNWGDTNDCPILTDLARDYKVSGISPSCTGSGTSLTTICRRSCGTCSWQSGVPGSQCSSSTPCNSPIYTAATGVVGTCFETPQESASLISGSSFCLSPFSAGDCGTISSDQCSNDGSIQSNCNQFCSSDYQCLDGYCNTGLGVCLLITTPAPTMAIKSTDCYCPRVTSDKAADFRDDINAFRPGDANGKYAFVGGTCSNPTECNDTLDDNPYIKSLVGFILIPFTFAIVMFIGYCCCCICWCSCGTWSKKKCCRCCLGDPTESMPARWGPTVFMAATLIVILWASIEGIIANAAMHDHVFDANNPSLRTEILGMFDTIIDKFEGVGPDADYIVNNVKDILGSVDGIIDNVDGNIGDPIDRIYGALNYIAGNYDNFSIPANITQPFGGNITTVNVPCDYCTGLNVQISGINDTFSSAVSVVNDMKSLINSSSNLVGAQDQIDEYVDKFNKMINNFTNQIESYQTDTAEYLNEYEGYDEDRESGGFVFFIVPFIWIILWVIGVILGILNKAEKAGEWCFKCTWCLAMFIGATIMLVFSMFAIISVGWADFCVNLDEFEADPLQSRLGQSITSFGSSSNSSDNSGQFDDIVEIVNACWTGADLLDIFNLSDLLDWDQYRGNLTDMLNVDITKELSIDALDSFTSEINLLNTDEFEVVGDEYLSALNDVGTDCVCQCGAIHGTSNAQFTRDKLRADQCYNNTGTGSPLDCWFDNFPLTQTATYCIGNFTLSYVSVNGEQQLQSQTQSAIDDIKNQTGIIISAYDEIFGIAVGIEDSIENISCSIDPIFEKFDALITNYSNCGFLGAIYGGFKDVGCVLLFTDMYWISASMMVIAFLSILVVCCGFMSQYSWHPVSLDTEEQIEHDFGHQMVRHASQKFQSTDFGRQVSQRVSGFSQKHLPGLSKNMSAELEMAQEMEMDEGGGDGGDNQPPPPGDTPPGTVDDGGAFTVPQNNNDDDQIDDDDMDNVQPSAPTDFNADTTQHGHVL